MNCAQFLISLVDAYGGVVQGRTMLQKLGFFASRLSGIEPGLGYDAHYYGPYSSVLDGTVAQLKNLGFLKEDDNAFGLISDGFEMRRYDYALTAEGKQVAEKLRSSEEYAKVRESIEKIKSGGAPTYIELSIAAKAYFILSQQPRKMSAEEILQEATKFNWKIESSSLKRAVQFLENVNLVTSAEKG